MPRHAGAALWARSLLNRIKHDWALLEAQKYFARTREADEAKVAFQQLVAVLEDYTMKMYQDWLGKMQGYDQSQMYAKLEIPPRFAGRAGADKGVVAAPRSQF